MNRTSALATLVLSTVICFHVAAAQTKKMPRLGWLSVGYGPKVNPYFRHAVRELGWYHGQNIEIVARFAYEKYDQLPKLAAELVQSNVMSLSQRIRR